MTNPTDKQPEGTGVVALRIRKDGAAPSTEAVHGDRPVVLARLPDLHYRQRDSSPAPPQARDTERDLARDVVRAEPSRSVDAPAGEKPQHTSGAGHGRRRRVRAVALRGWRSLFYQLGVTALGITLLVLVMMGLTRRHADETTEQPNATWPESGVATGAPEGVQISQGELVETEPSEESEHRLALPSRTWMADKAELTDASEARPDAPLGARASQDDLVNDSVADPGPGSSASTAPATKRDTWLPREKEPDGPQAGQLDFPGAVVDPLDESAATKYHPWNNPVGTSGSVVDRLDESAGTKYIPSNNPVGTGGSVVDGPDESAATPSLPKGPAAGPDGAPYEEVETPLPELYGPRRQRDAPETGGLPSASDSPSLDQFPSAHVYPATDYADTYPDLSRRPVQHSQPAWQVRTAQRRGAANYPSTGSKPVVGLRAPIHLEQRIEPLPTKSHERHE